MQIFNQSLSVFGKVGKIKMEHFSIVFNEQDINKCAMYENYWM